MMEISGKFWVNIRNSELAWHKTLLRGGVEYLAEGEGGASVLRPRGSSGLLTVTELAGVSGDSGSMFIPTFMDDLTRAEAA